MAWIEVKGNSLGAVGFPWGTLPLNGTRRWDIPEKEIAKLEAMQRKREKFNLPVTFTVKRVDGPLSVVEKPAPEPAPEPEAPKEVEEAPETEPTPAEPESSEEVEEKEDSSEEAPQEPSEDPLDDAYEVVFGKRPEGEISRDELKQMYESFFGEDPGRMYSTTIREKLRDVASS